MPQTITATATWAEVTAAPQDGDDAAADTGDAPLEAVLQILANRDAYIVDALRAVTPARIGGFSTGGQITVEAHQRWIGGLLRTIGAGTLTLSGLSAGWYYVYEYLLAGSVVREAVTTVPDPATGYTTKTGATSHLFCFAFYALTATTCRPFRTRGGRCTYLVGAGTSTTSDFVALNAGNATSYTAVNLATWMPPHAVTWLFQAAFVAQVAGVGSWLIRPNGQTSASHGSAQQNVATLGEYLVSIEMARHPSGTVSLDYSVTDVSAGSAPHLSIYVTGFQE